MQVLIASACQLTAEFTTVTTAAAKHALQAFTTPAAYTLLADAFPESSRATANGIYSSGVYVGGACASLTVLLTASIGWRDCSLLAGSVGIATALLAQAVLREPQLRRLTVTHIRSGLHHI